jgi:hypothetical protein
MELTKTRYATAMRPAFVAPTLGAAGEQSVFCRVADHAQASLPITGAAGMVTGRRPWSPLMT